MTFQLAFSFFALGVAFCLAVDAALSRYWAAAFIFGAVTVIGLTLALSAGSPW